MKNIIFIVIGIFTIACQEKAKNGEFKNSKEKTEEALISPKKMCFLSVLGNTEIQGKKVSDSLIMQLEIHGNTVTGTYDWIPAEKDSRRGKISAKKEGNQIRGSYIFTQEGRKQTQHIEIDLQGNLAKVTITPGYPEKMVVEIQKIVGFHRK